MRVEQIKKIIPKPVKKIIKDKLNKSIVSVDKSKVSNDVKESSSDKSEIELQHLIKKQKLKRKENKNFDIRATYVEHLGKPLKKQIIVIGSIGGSFSGTIISKFAEIINNKEMDVIVALDKLTDPFPYAKIRTVKKYSIDFVEALAQSRIVLTQGLLPYYFQMRDGQDVVNTLDEVNEQIEDIVWPLQTPGVRLQHSILQSTELIGLPGVNIIEILRTLGINRIYQGKIVENYNLNIHFEENIKKEGKKFPLKTPYAVRKYTKDHSTLNILLIHLEKTKSLNISTTLKSIISQQIDKLVLIDVAPHIHKQLYKDAFLKEYIIGINRNIEPYLKNVTELYTDSFGYSSLFTNIEVKLFNYLDDDTYSIEDVNPLRIMEHTSRLINDKKNILMYGGGFYNNGITSSVLNLSNYLDYEKYNLIIIEKGEFKSSDKDNIQKLSPKATVIQRFGVSVFDEQEQAIHEMITLKSGYENWMEKINPFNQYRREIKRMTGLSSFDYAVDFGGYSSYYEALILSVNAQKHTIFLHNDMWEETKRFVDGQFIMQDTLMRIFKLYQFFDCYVSVSEEVMKQNQIKLSDFTNKDKFFTVNNLINKFDIQKKRFDPNIAMIQYWNENYYITYDSENDKSIDSGTFLAPSNGKFTFVMAGRLSPEKGHKKMIDAVKLVQDNSNVEFEVLVLGEGPLKEELNKYSLIQGVAHIVKFVGQVANPYYYFDHSDAFLMTSDHEGQPMVLLEAASMGLPILATDIPGNRSVVSKFGGELVENTVEGLQEAMRNTIENPLDLKKPDFDIDQYNEVSYQVLEKTVLGE
ncbi:glycosyltransferase [Weissella paramesenteroides]|uniref:glycosyltransferase n=1 Tax=Weissella paramesenteroides TaxID=1249 RepID=UPI002402A250|nr:glycosyltransferase [Weissella paramesenteroides]MDF8367412.1 glycosyltransferase [Weissella paramesenteroides]